MNANRYLSGGLTADDVPDEGLALIISDVEEKEFKDDNGHEQLKLAVQFEETGKSLILNKTNLSRLIELHGADTDNWIGKAIGLERATAQFAGKIVPAVRVS